MALRDRLRRLEKEGEGEMKATSVEGKMHRREQATGEGGDAETR